MLPGLELWNPAVFEGSVGKDDRGLQVTGNEVSSNPVEAHEVVLKEEEKLLEGSEEKIPQGARRPRRLERCKK
jgi:hypothetical protein